MLVGLYPIVFSLLGFDSQVHMGESMKLRLHIRTLRLTSF